MALRVHLVTAIDERTELVIKDDRLSLHVAWAVDEESLDPVANQRAKRGV